MTCSHSEGICEHAREANIHRDELWSKQLAQVVAGHILKREEAERRLMMLSRSVAEHLFESEAGTGQSYKLLEAAYRQYGKQD